MSSERLLSASSAAAGRVRPSAGPARRWRRVKKRLELCVMRGRAVHRARAPAPSTSLEPRSRSHVGDAGCIMRRVSRRRGARIVDDALAVFAATIPMRAGLHPPRGRATRDRLTAVVRSEISVPEIAHAHRSHSRSEKSAGRYQRHHRSRRSAASRSSTRWTRRPAHCSSTASCTHRCVIPAITASCRTRSPATAIRSTCWSATRARWCRAASSMSGRSACW